MKFVKKFNRISLSNEKKKVDKRKKINSGLAIGQYLINNLKCLVNYN